MFTFVSRISNCRYVMVCVSGIYGCLETVTRHYYPWTPGRTEILSELSQHWLCTLELILTAASWQSRWHRQIFLPPANCSWYLPSHGQDTTQSTHSDSIIAQKPRRTTGPGPGTDQPKYLWCDGDNNREPGVAWSVCSSKAKQPDGVINNLPARLGKPSSSDWPGHARH